MINRNNHICALDIGTSKISACLASCSRGRVGRLVYESAPSRGVKDGAIVDSVELVNAATRLLKSLRKKSGVPIKSVYANISGHDILTRHSRAIIPLTERGNKVITLTDVQSVHEQARVLGSTLEDEIIYSVAHSYAIDTKDGVKNPLGLYSHRFEVDLFMVCAKLGSMQSLSRAMDQSGVTLKKVYVPGIAVSAAVLDRELGTGFTILCDIGADTTELLLYSDGILQDVEILSFGGNHLTAKIQDALKIPFDLAEDIKRSYGIIGEADHIEEDKEILVRRSELYTPIKQKLIAQIITDSAHAICEQIKQAVERRLAHYKVDHFIVSGRTVLLEGFIEAMEGVLGIPVVIAKVSNPKILPLVKDDPALSGQKYLPYLVCFGIIASLLQQDEHATAPGYGPAKNFMGRAMHRFKEVYQEYF